MYKFNNNDIVTGYIKELLHSFNLPQAHVLTSGMRVFPNNNYIHKNYVYKFTGTYSINLPTDLSNLPTTMKIVKNYFYGQNIANITKNLEIRSPLYDTYTHKYLGDYLRFHRDYLNINLMSMYNCFSNEMSNHIDLKINNSVFNSNDQSSKIYVIPVKLFQEYTIGIDCDTKIEMFCGFYSDGMITVVDESSDARFYTDTYQRKIGTRFKKPFLYSKLKNISNIAKKYYDLEKQLVMILKIPFACESSITILEGNYLENCNVYFSNDLEKLSNTPLLYKHNNVDVTKYTFISKSQLLNYNSNVSAPFADRLVEYIFGNVVDSSDKIEDNIKRVQKILIKNGKVKLSYVKTYGEWSEDIRKTLYANGVLLGLVDKKFDLLGYYDKDIEEVLGE